MKIVNIRRISQVFFLLLFLWLCVVSTVGTAWWQLRGWPVNFFVNIDPLTAIGVLLATGVVYAGLALSLVTIVLTFLFGRFFCGWVCPFGTLHQAVGYLGRTRQSLMARLKKNSYRPAQRIKYYILFFILAAALAGLISTSAAPEKTTPFSRLVAGSLQSGLLDPISLMQRSVNLVLLPITDRLGQDLSPTPRFYTGAGIIGFIFLGALLLNLVIPRFYCRFLCPLGALLGIFSRFPLWRISKTRETCSMCMQCEMDCEGACEPAGKIRTPECVLCMNCLNICDEEVITYGIARSAGGDHPAPDVTRRGILISIASGLFAIPMIRLSDRLGMNWSPRLIRPPGALPENEFLNRCIKCGECMRICPTNVIQPAGLEAGAEGIWTPILNFRIGTSGCQLNCVSCGNVCPTAAIRPITLDEKLGHGDFASQGPIRLGTAFVDRSRCLPWGMDRPCIVCQENCPVSPKAIYVKEYFSTVRNGIHTVVRADELTVDLGKPVLVPGAYATGDYYCLITSDSENHPHRIVDNTESLINIDSTNPIDPPPKAGTRVAIQVRLQAPVVDPDQCIGCGICEHECPVTGIKAIRITADNESRDPKHSFLL